MPAVKSLLQDSQVQASQSTSSPPDPPTPGGLSAPPPASRIVLCDPPWPSTGRTGSSTVAFRARVPAWAGGWPPHTSRHVRGGPQGQAVVLEVTHPFPSVQLLPFAQVGCCWWPWGPCGWIVKSTPQLSARRKQETRTAPSPHVPSRARVGHCSTRWLRSWNPRLRFGSPPLLGGDPHTPGHHHPGVGPAGWGGCREAPP